jgi:XTP/dITP diphosphohydrolase
MEIILSTRNRGKAEQINRMFVGTPIRVISLEEAGIEGIVKEGTISLEENANLKNLFAWRHSQDKYVVSEDTGLFIDALGGAPGVITSDWAGENVKGEALRDFVIEQIKKLPKGSRSAHWRTIAILREPKGNYHKFEGTASGTLIEDPRGNFVPSLPYSQLFVVDGPNKTWAEMSIDEENVESHRGKAFAQVKEFLLSQL